MKFNEKKWIILATSEYGGSWEWLTGAIGSKGDDIVVGVIADCPGQGTPDCPEGMVDASVVNEWYLLRKKA